MPLLEKYRKRHVDDKSLKCTYHDDVKDCKVDAEFIIWHPQGWNIYLCSYCVVILLGEINYNLKK